MLRIIFFLDYKAVEHSKAVEQLSCIIKEVNVVHLYLFTSVGIFALGAMLLSHSKFMQY